MRILKLKRNSSKPESPHTQNSTLTTAQKEKVKKIVREIPEVSGQVVSMEGKEKATGLISYKV